MSATVIDRTQWSKSNAKEAENLKAQIEENLSRLYELGAWPEIAGVTKMGMELIPPESHYRKMMAVVAKELVS